MKKDNDGSRKAFTGLAHKVKNVPTMQGSRVLSLGLENPLEKGMATHSSLEDPMGRGAWWATVHGV